MFDPIIAHAVIVLLLGLSVVKCVVVCFRSCESCVFGCFRRACCMCAFVTLILEYVVKGRVLHK
jgi:hypothetical protein